MGVIITTTTDSFKIDLNGTSLDTNFARIKYDSIRSLKMSTDLKTVNLVFYGGEIHPTNFENVDTFEGVAVTTQQMLYDKFEAKMFA